MIRLPRFVPGQGFKDVSATEMNNLVGLVRAFEEMKVSGGLRYTNTGSAATLDVKIPKSSQSSTQVFPNYFKVVAIEPGGDALECNPCDGDGGNTNASVTVFVAMGYLARRSSTDGEERAGISYVFTSDEQRTATLPRTGQEDVEQEEVRVPSYQPGDVVFAEKPGRPTGVFHVDLEADPKPTSTAIVWQDKCERGWGKLEL